MFFRRLCRPHYLTLIGLFVPLIVFAQLDMNCYERCRADRNEAMHCQSRCTQHQQSNINENEILSPHSNNDNEPSWALGAAYKGEANAIQREMQLQQMLNLMLQNKLLRLQAENIKQESRETHNAETATVSSSKCTTDSQCVRGYSCRTRPDSDGARYCSPTSDISNSHGCSVDADCATGSCRSKRGGGTECR